MAPILRRDTATATAGKFTCTETRNNNGKYAGKVFAINVGVKVKDVLK